MIINEAGKQIVSILLKSRDFPVPSYLLRRKGKEAAISAGQNGLCRRVKVVRSGRQRDHERGGRCEDAE